MTSSFVFTMQGKRPIEMVDNALELDIGEAPASGARRSRTTKRSRTAPPSDWREFASAYLSQGSQLKDLSEEAKENLERFDRVSLFANHGSGVQDPLPRTLSTVTLFDEILGRQVPVEAIDALIDGVKVRPVLFAAETYCLCSHFPQGVLQIGENASRHGFARSTPGSPTRNCSNCGVAERGHLTTVP